MRTATTSSSSHLALSFFSLNRFAMSFRNDHGVHHLVTYCCGSCGYELHLSSADRDTAGIGSSKYGKAIRKGVVSFHSIDESRFSQTDELKIRPYFSSRHSWGLLRRRTRLVCRKCRSFIGSAYEEPSSPVASDSSDSSSTEGVAAGKKYDIKISALQPTAAAATGGERGIPFYA